MSDEDRRAPVDQRGSLRQRVALTYRSQGLRVLVARSFAYPLRFTPLAARLDPRRRAPLRSDRAAALRSYRRRGRAVTVVIVGADDGTLAAAIRAGCSRRLTRIVSAPAAEIATALASIPRRHDAVLIDQAAEPQPGWLQCLQYATRWDDRVAVVSPLLIGPEGLIQAAGLAAPYEGDRPVPRLHGRPAGYSPAQIPVQIRAAGPECVYLTRPALRAALRAPTGSPATRVLEACRQSWCEDRQVVYWPSAVVRVPVLATAGSGAASSEPPSPEPPSPEPPSPEPPSPAGRHASPAGRHASPAARAARRPRVIYVTEDTGVGGGHRDVFEHLGGLARRGWDAELWTLADPPNWFALDVPVRSFPHYGALVPALTPVDAIKVATWWNTAQAVWRASVRHGTPVYFVQDLETSYYPDDETLRSAVLASYREEFRHITISPWLRDRLGELGAEAELIPPGIDLRTFRPLPGVPRDPPTILALGRSNPLKNLRLTLDAWRSLPEPRPELVLFGIEPELAGDETGVRYVTAPSDAEVVELFNRATVFVQTSIHEGFCLPVLESMATGGAVVCTDSHGNRGFCSDGDNCLMPAPTAAAVAAAIGRLLADGELRATLGEAGLRTAAEYAWPRRIDALERFLLAAAR